ncbi:LysR substrate-binding domain-containing protein [Rhizobium sp. Root1203]|uniref:LysR substrate-binding domain-containing protein n=1 Tax=Rhizobium sp. Root1203 TaxID=1736427 RepID=UPI000ADA5B63
MTLRELEYLIALANHRHFGRAAEECQVAQPTLSTQIRKLEEDLGAPLIERTSRSLMLTSFGQDTVERARRIMTEVEEMKAAARRSRNPEAGTLRLGIFPTLAPYFLPHAVPRIRETFPGLEMLLIEEKSDGLLSRLHNGNLDAAILALPVGDDRLTTELLFSERFLLAVPASHSLAERKELALADLNGYNLMLLEEGHCLRDQALDVCRLAGASRAYIVSRNQPGDASPDGWGQGRDDVAAGARHASLSFQQHQASEFHGFTAKSPDRHLLAEGLGDASLPAGDRRVAAWRLQSVAGSPADACARLGVSTREVLHFHSHSTDDENGRS